MSDFTLYGLGSSKQARGALGPCEDGANSIQSGAVVEMDHLERDLKQITETCDTIEQMIRQNSSIAPSNTPIQSPRQQRLPKTGEKVVLPEPRIIDFDSTSPKKGNISMNELLIKSQPTGVEDLKFHELFDSYTPTKKPSSAQDNANYTYRATSNATSSAQNQHNTSYLTSMEDISTFGILDNNFETKHYQTTNQETKDPQYQYLTLDASFSSSKKLKDIVVDPHDDSSNDILSHTLLLPQFPSSPLSKLTSQFPNPRPFSEMFELEDPVSRESTPEPNFNSYSRKVNLTTSLEKSLASNKRKLEQLQECSPKKPKHLQRTSDEDILPLLKALKAEQNPSPPKFSHSKEFHSSTSLKLESSSPVAPRQSNLRVLSNKEASSSNDGEVKVSGKAMCDVLRAQRRALRNISKRQSYEISPIKVNKGVSSPLSEWIGSSPLKSSPVNIPRRKIVTLPSLTPNGMVKRAAALNSKIIPRSKNGCWTCRIRKKKCTENKPWCDECKRLGLHCDGYGMEKPDFFEDQAQKRKKLDLIKTHTMKLKKEQMQLRMEANKSLANLTGISTTKPKKAKKTGTKTIEQPVVQPPNELAK